MAESWDADSDIILPDGPLTLLHSDTDLDPDNDPSSPSSLFPQPHPLPDAPLRGGPGNAIPCGYDRPSQRSPGPDLSPGFDSGDDIDNADRENLEKGGTLRLKIIKRQRPAPSFDEPPQDAHLIRYGLNAHLSPHHHLLSSSSSGEDRDEGDDSLSSNHSSERQSTLKAAFTIPLSPHPSRSPAQAAKQFSSHLSQRSSALPGSIDPTVLAVLASGATGTVTKLEPNKRTSPLHAGLDWDEDILLPEGGLHAAMNKGKAQLHASSPQVRKRASFASTISDELCEDALDPRDRQSSSAFHSTYHRPHSPLKPKKLVPQLGRVGEKDKGFTKDLLPLPTPEQACKLTTPSKPRSALRKQHIGAGFSSSDMDFLGDDPTQVHRFSASPLSSAHKATRLPRSGSSSTSVSFCSSGSTAEEATPRIRTRPSLTPSLMSDRSSSPFTEAEDDLNEGFFDDIEFPPDFGIPRNITPMTSVVPAGSEPAKPGHTCPSHSSRPVVDPKGKQPQIGPSVDLQSYLDMKVKARAMMSDRVTNGSLVDRPLPQSRSAQSFVTVPSIPSSSSSTTIVDSSSASRALPVPSGLSKVGHPHGRPCAHPQLHPWRNFRAYEDRTDERVEDGLEIEVDSIRPEKLRSRTSSSISSASSQRPPHRLSGRTPLGQQLYGRVGAVNVPSGSPSHSPGAIHQQQKSKRMTVPFPSASPSRGNSNLPGSRHLKTGSLRSLSTHLSNTSASAANSHAPAVPHPSLLHRPSSTLSSTSHARSAAKSIPHRPLSVATTSSSRITCTTTDSAIPSADSFKAPRVRAKSLRSSLANSRIGGALPHTLIDPSTHAQAPPCASSRKLPATGKLGSLMSSPLGSRLRTLATSTSGTNLANLPVSGPPILSANNQRTLKHKSSAQALKCTTGSGHVSHQLRDTKTALFPSSSQVAGHGRAALARKRSMPLLNHDGHHRTGGVRSGSSHTSGATTPTWKQGSERLKSRLPGERPFSPSAAPWTSATPSYADPTQASMNRQACCSATHLPTIAASPERVILSKRKSVEIGRPGAASPVLNSVSSVSSRLTMPTIASRLKAKPCVLHEANPHSAGEGAQKKWASGYSFPHQLRHPRKVRSYGDGTELDHFDDLPTSKDKEKMFTKAVQTAVGGGPSHSKAASTSKSLPLPEKKDNGTLSTTGNRCKQRLESRKADGVRKRKQAMGQVSNVSTKKGLIRQMSMNTLTKSANHGEMKWNEHDARWEGNECVLREFDNVLSSSSRPALISQLSIQSPSMKLPTRDAPQDDAERGGLSKANKAQNHVVGGMIFDSELMCWKSREVDGEDELMLESDEELELKWQADDEGSIGGEWMENFPEGSEGRSRKQSGRNGAFWEQCLAAEARHWQEIQSWVPKVCPNAAEHDVRTHHHGFGQHRRGSSTLSSPPGVPRPPGINEGVAHKEATISRRSNWPQDEHRYLQEIRRLVLEGS